MRMEPPDLGGRKAGLEIATVTTRGWNSQENVLKLIQFLT